MAGLRKGADFPDFLFKPPCVLFEIPNSAFNVSQLNRPIVECNNSSAFIIQENIFIRKIESSSVALALQELHGVCTLSRQDVRTFFPPRAWGRNVDPDLPFVPGGMENLVIQFHSDRTSWVIQDCYRHALNSAAGEYCSSSRSRVFASKLLLCYLMFGARIKDVISMMQLNLGYECHDMYTHHSNSDSYI